MPSPRPSEHSTRGYAEPLNKVKCTEEGAAGEEGTTKGREYHWYVISAIVAYTQVQELDRTLDVSQGQDRKEKSLREERSKESWLTLGPVIKKLFTDLEKETAY